MLGRLGPLDACCCCPATAAAAGAQPSQAGAWQPVGPVSSLAGVLVPLRSPAAVVWPVLQNPLQPTHSAHRAATCAPAARTTLRHCRRWLPPKLCWRRCESTLPCPKSCWWRGLATFTGCACCFHFCDVGGCGLRVAWQLACPLVQDLRCCGLPFVRRVAVPLRQLLHHLPS